MNNSLLVVILSIIWSVVAILDSNLGASVDAELIGYSIVAAALLVRVPWK